MHSTIVRQAAPDKTIQPRPPPIVHKRVSRDKIGYPDPHILISPHLVHASEQLWVLYREPHQL